MTRAQYQATYGSAPAIPVSAPTPTATPTASATASAPVQMTRAQYQAQYGVAPVVPVTTSAPVPAADPFNALPTGGNTINDWQPNILSQIGNATLGGASDLGVHLGKVALGALAKGAGALGLSGAQQALQARADAPAKNIFGVPVASLQNGLGAVEQFGGDILKTGAEAATALVAPETVGGAALAGGGIGAAQGAGGAMQQAQGPVDVAKEGLVGGAVGGATAGAVAGLGKLLSYLPSRLIQSALPKLKPENIPNVLQDTKLGTIGSMLEDSQGNVSNLGGQVQDILKSEQYASHIGDGNAAIDDALHSFPNSEYTRPDIISATKNVVPGQAALVTKLDNGTATLAEKNTLRQAIDAATKKIFTDSPQVSAQKQIAAALASSLRSEVQNTAPETKPIFAQLSKEINLRNALAATAKKLDSRSPINLYSILSFLTGGLPAALGEEFARSPATSIAAGKATSVAAPALQRAASVIGGLSGGMTAGGGENANTQP